MNNTPTPTHADVHNHVTGLDCQRKVVCIKVDEYGDSIGHVKVGHEKVEVILRTFDEHKFWDLAWM
tara:strand:- start:458 stop:655 length:198 start_codon:yes stop_codon:yes gene_type:complete